jgi:hypothetical protein
MIRLLDGCPVFKRLPPFGWELTIGCGMLGMIRGMKLTAEDAKFFRKGTQRQAAFGGWFCRTKHRLFPDTGRWGKKRYGGR